MKVDDDGKIFVVRKITYITRRNVHEEKTTYVARKRLPDSRPSSRSCHLSTFSLLQLALHLHLLLGFTPPVIILHHRNLLLRTHLH